MRVVSARRNVGLMAAVILLAAGCAKHSTSGASVPPEYRITQALATLVEANKAATEVSIQLNKAGQISDQTAAEILSYTALVAQASKTALVAMDGTAALDVKRAQIQAAFSKLIATAAVHQYLAANKDTKTAAALVAAIQSVQLLVDSILTEVA